MTLGLELELTAFLAASFHSWMMMHECIFP
jgi:hypothetical protein